MKYFIQLRKHDQPFYTLEYDIFEHELAQEWAKVFQHARGGQPVSVPSMFPKQVLVPGKATKMPTNGCQRTCCQCLWRIF